MIRPGIRGVRERRTTQSRMEQWAEQRRHIRSSVSVVATVVTGEGLCRTPAQIVNLSPVGAMLEIQGQEPLPKEFDLLYEHTLQPVRLVWQSGHVAGVFFLT